MKLTLKLSVAFLIGLTLVLSAYAWSTWKRETDSFSSDMRHDNLLTGHVVAAAIEHLDPLADANSVAALMRRITRFETPVRLRWVSLTAAPGSPAAPLLAATDMAALASGRPVAITAAHLGTSGASLTYVPVGTDAVHGAIEVSEPLTELDHYRHATLVRIASTSAAVAIVSGTLALLIGTRLVGRPVARLVEGFHYVAQGDLSHRPPVRQRDELGVLAREFGAMCDRLAEARTRADNETAKRLEAMEQLRHADRLRTVGQLTAGVAHELGTPLNVVWARASMIARGEATGDEVTECAAVIEDQSQRMTRIIRKLLEFARPQPPRKSPIDLQNIVQQTLDVLGATARKQNVAFVRAGDSDAVRVAVDASQIQQVLSNLVLNAIQAMPNGGAMTIGIQSERIQPPADIGGPTAEYHCVFVEDQGTGIASKDLTRIFEPFFTTKDIGVGTGLGLSISRGIIVEHGGWISATSRPGSGARFCVYLPKETSACAVAS